MTCFTVGPKEARAWTITHGAKEAGTFRLEGKDYVVQHGAVPHVRIANLWHSGLCRRIIGVLQTGTPPPFDKLCAVADLGVDLDSTARSAEQQ